MPALIERPKMSLAMWAALKAHIMHQREKRKQEQEQDAAIEQLRREQEQKRKQDAMTLEEIKDQIQRLEQKLEDLKEEKHQFFLQLKKVLNEDDTRRRVKEVKEASEMIPLSHTYITQGLALGAPSPMYLQGNQIIGRAPTMYKITPPPTSVHGTLKRPRSPSPTQPMNFQQNYPYKTQVAAYQQNDAAFPYYSRAVLGGPTRLTKLKIPSTECTTFANSDDSAIPYHYNRAVYGVPSHLTKLKILSAECTSFGNSEPPQFHGSQPTAFYPHAAAAAAAAAAQVANAGTVAPGPPTASVATAVVAGGASPYPVYSGAPSAAQYQPQDPASQAKHLAPPGYHLAHIQQNASRAGRPVTIDVDKIKSMIAIDRHLTSRFSGAMQQQLEHANQKSAFVEEKYYVQQGTVVPIRGVTPIPGSQTVIPIQQQSKPGGITSGYPVRAQPPPPPPPTTQHYQSQPPSNPPPSHGPYGSQHNVPRHPYPGQPTTRYY